VIKKIQDLKTNALKVQVSVRDFFGRVPPPAPAIEPVLPEIINREIVDQQNDNEGGYCLIYLIVYQS
jgi:hypothetical protein